MSAFHAYRRNRHGEASWVVRTHEREIYREPLPTVHSAHAYTEAENRAIAVRDRWNAGGAGRERLLRKAQEADEAAEPRPHASSSWRGKAARRRPRRAQGPG